MPTEVLPITDLDKIGLVMDTPSVSLPPNVFSDCRNVRFRDGAIRKMEGETSLFQDIDPAYVLYWQGPFNNMYVFVQHDGDIFLQEADANGIPTTRAPRDIGDFPTLTIAQSRFQHTFFNGGFNLIINNGVSTPLYLTDHLLFDEIGRAAELPNWDSYLAQENVVSVVWDEDYPDIPLGRAVSLDLEVVDSDGMFVRNNVAGSQRIVYRVIPRDPSLPILTQRVNRLVVTGDNTQTSTEPSDYSAESTDYFTVRGQGTDNWLITPRRRDSSVTPTILGAEPGDTIEIAIQERPEIIVTAGVIRAYGNLLVAGNLREVAGGNILRNLAGVIRTSDVAPPGNVPANWNPFRNGANTADEFTLSSTGTVQDMVELQGNLFIYTTNSIHSLQQTGGNIPFGVRPVTDNYGADNTGSVIEVDGKHIVVGSDDIYVFAGHPGSIQSIADSRVRHQPFFDDGREVRILRYSTYDELWFYSPDNADPTMFIWNYRDNTWSIRNQTSPLVGNQGPNYPIFIERYDPTAPLELRHIYRTNPQSFTLVNGITPYLSYIERTRLAITPEFTTETLVSIGILSEGNAEFEVAVVGTNRPAQDVTLPTDDMNQTPFSSQEDYKADIRTHGRLLNYRIHEEDSIPWSIAGMQFDIGTGGTR